MATTTLSTTATGSGVSRPRRLGTRSRKAVLVVHMVSAGAWIGLDVVLAVLVFTARLTDDVRVRAVCYQALELVAVAPMIGAALVCLASGVLLGLGTKYGLVRYWWVIVKLALNLALATLVLFALRPGVVAAGEYGRGLAVGSATDPSAVGDLLFPAVVSPTALLVAVVLTYFKPWGRRGRQR